MWSRCSWYSNSFALLLVSTVMTAVKGVVFEPANCLLPGAAWRPFTMAVERACGEEHEWIVRCGLSGLGFGRGGFGGGEAKSDLSAREADCGEGCRQKEIATGLIFDHAKVNHIQAMEVKGLLCKNWLMGWLAELGDEVAEQREEKRREDEGELLTLEVTGASAGHARDEGDAEGQAAEEAAEVGAVVDADADGNDSRCRGR